MFKTYKHAELLQHPGLKSPDTQHWEFIELELHHPWFFLELETDHRDSVDRSMLMLPTIPIFQSLLDELNNRRRITHAYLVSPGHTRREQNWKMENLDKVILAKDKNTQRKGYVYITEDSKHYSDHHYGNLADIEVIDIIFDSKQHLHVSPED